MSNVKVKKPSGSATGTVELPADVFDVEPNLPLMHQVVVAQLAAARAGTHSTKTRGEVRGGGRKPYRQKGTGRARQGSVRAPQFAGGGVVHGPKPRDYSQRTPKKMKAAALRGALSDRARAGLVHVLTAVLEGSEPSTKAARKTVEAIGTDSRLLFVVGRDDELGWLSLRNLPNVHLIAPDQLNTYDVLVNDEVVFTQQALELFLSVARRGPSETTETTETDSAEDAKPARKPRKAASDKTATDKAATDKAGDEVDSEAEPKPAPKAEPKAAAKKPARRKASEEPTEQPSGEEEAE